MCKSLDEGGHRCQGRVSAEKDVREMEQKVEATDARMMLLYALRDFVENYQRENLGATYAEARRAYIAERNRTVDKVKPDDLPKSATKLRDAITNQSRVFTRRSERLKNAKVNLQEINDRLAEREDAREERRNRVPVSIKEIQAEEKRQNRENQREFNARMSATKVQGRPKGSETEKRLRTMTDEELDAANREFLKNSKEAIARARA